MNERLPEFQDLLDAAARIRPWVRRTPVVQSAALDARFGARLFFKCENLQYAGAFKSRGACNAVFQLPDAIADKGVATHSSGNHAAALARAGRLRGMPVHVVMPRDANPAKRALVEAEGARITECEPGMAGRLAALRQVVDKTGAHVVPPYDDARIIAGQGTAALELLEERPELDLLLAPVGGGGLLAGTALAAAGMARGPRVIGVEPAAADDACRALRTGRIEAVAKPDTIADGLRATLGTLPFAVLRRHVDTIVTVSEADIVRAMRLLWEKLGMLIEPSAAVPLAGLLSGAVEAAGRRVGMILTGGNVDLDARLPWQKN